MTSKTRYELVERTVKFAIIVITRSQLEYGFSVNVSFRDSSNLCLPEWPVGYYGSFTIALRPQTDGFPFLYL